MLPAEALDAALASCTTEVFWRPLHEGGILAVPLDDEGTAGGVEVPAYKARHKFQALVVAVNETKRVQVGDMIVFDFGRGEEITTAAGESFWFTTEKGVAAVDDEFNKPPEVKETLLASGLWVSTDAGV